MIRLACRSEAKPLIGIYAESGAGKTWSSLLLARGFVGSTGKICMIETEGGRGEANVGRDPVGDYLVRPIRSHFPPSEYGAAISEAETEKVDALIIDSASHEWEGAGGVLAMAADNQANGIKGVLVWQRPKIEHQRHFMLRLTQTPIPLVIVCMRAKYPMIEKLKDGKKEWTRAEYLEPKQADDILFEMFVHGWIDQQHNFHGTKYTIPELASIFPKGKPIDIATGKDLAAWARSESSNRQHPAADSVAPVHTAPAPTGAADFFPGDQSLLKDNEITAAEWDLELAEAAKKGMIALQECWALIPKQHHKTLKAALDRRHKPNAMKVQKEPASDEPTG